MAGKGEYRLVLETPIRQIESRPRGYGVMFNPSSSRSRLRVMDSGRRYEILLTVSGMVNYSVDGVAWHSIQPTPDPCTGIIPSAFISYNEFRAGAAVQPEPRFDMIAVGRGRILAKERGSDRLFHLVMDEIFRTHRVVGKDCKLYSNDPDRPEDPPVPGSYWKLDPEFFVSGGGGTTPPELDRDYSRHPASLRFPVFREVLKLDAVDAMLVLQRPRVWYLIDARSPLMITGPDDLRITEADFQTVFQGNAGSTRLVDILTAAYATEKVKVETVLENLLNALIGGFWTTARRAILGGLIGGSLGGIIGGIVGAFLGGLITALGGAVLGAIGGAILGGIVVPYIVDTFMPWVVNQIVNGLAGLVIREVAAKMHRAIRCEGFGALVLPLNLGVLWGLYKLREVDGNQSVGPDGCPVSGNRALDTIAGIPAINLKKALAKFTEAFPANKPLDDVISLLMRQARGGHQIPNLPPQEIPTYGHLHYERDGDGDIQHRVSIQFSEVLDLGVGYSHWSEQWQRTFGTEMNNLNATRPIAQQERYNLIQYRLLNGPVIDMDGYNDGTCNFYMLVRLGEADDKNAGYAILWMDEQSYITQRWRLLHPTDDYRGDWFSLGRVLVDNLRERKDWFRFDPDKYWSPLEAGCVGDFSRMRVRRQLIALTGYDPTLKRHEIYTICFNYGVCDHTWRWRLFPDDADQQLLEDDVAGGPPRELHLDSDDSDNRTAVVYVNSVELRDDLTLHVRGFKRLASGSGRWSAGRWFQNYLPADSRHAPWAHRLVSGRKPTRGFSHDWDFISETAFKRADQFYQFGIYEQTTDARCQYYEIDLLADKEGHIPEIAAINDQVWRCDRKCDPIDPLAIDTENIDLAIQSDANGYIALNTSTLVQERGKFDTMSMYEPTTRFCLRERKPKGVIAVFFDKRDDELQSASHLPRETVLCRDDVNADSAEIWDEELNPARAKACAEQRETTKRPAIEVTARTRVESPPPEKIRVVFKANHRVMNAPVVRKAKITRRTVADHTAALRIAFWAPLSQDEVYENIWKVSLGALESSTALVLFQSEVFGVFARQGVPLEPLPLYYSGQLDATYRYEYVWSGFDGATAAELDKYCTALGRVQHGTSIWFEDIVGHRSIAETTVFDELEL
jgi:hypothetical protein